MNKPCCPLSASRWRFCPNSMARSSTASNCVRRAPSGIKRSGFDEALQNALVQEAQIHMLAEFHQVIKSAQLLPRRHHRFDGAWGQRF